jgi:hypothetical protein
MSRRDYPTPQAWPEMNETADMAASRLIILQMAFVRACDWL